MLGYIVMLLGFQLAGETLVKLSGLPVPGEAAGAFAGLAMGLNGLLTAILLPLLWRLLT